jgi:uncharacterized membrane protein
MMSDTPEPNRLPAEIEKIAASVVQKVPEQLRPEVIRAFGLVFRRTVRFHSGPLPDPETLERYGRLIPNGCERIMQLVEGEASHRHTQEAAVVSGNMTLALRGQWISAGLVVMLAVIGVGLTLKGFPAVASVIFATTIAAVAAIFIYGRRKEEDSDGTIPGSK